MKYILKNKLPVKCENLLEWSMWFAKTDRVIASDVIDESLVSTVFLGIDRDTLFETMVFGGQLDGYFNRYMTYEAAELGHGEIVGKLKKVEKNFKVD